ncbi:MAG: hypothetical protein KDD50_00735 [Bdellovibrionales bacterium]|nr:hypothetical protein [Bdellovibrionales bacterium]
MQDVVVVSIFGRGNWLASELADNNFKVSLVDISQEFGRWAPEDWEGPFGFFQTSQLKASQLERLSEEDYLEPIEEGFTLLLDKGPLELTGSMAQFCLDKYKIHPAGLRYVENYSKNREIDKSQLSNIRNDSFENNWFVQLSHQLASHVYRSNTDSLSEGYPLPLFSPYFIRRVTRRGQDKSLDWCEKKGVQVFRNAQILDMRLSHRDIESLELKSDWSGVLESKNFVWCLSGLESQRLSGNITSSLFPKGPIVPTWSWIRYRFDLNLNENTNVIPSKFIIINDKYLSWSHENLCVLQKTVKDGQYDIWVRIPSQQRFHRSYIDELMFKISNIVDDKIPLSSPQIVDKPQDYLYEESELGPSRFPVYSAEDLKKRKDAPYSNLFFDGPEYWPLLEWNSQFSHQEDVLKRIINWRSRQLAKQKIESEVSP